MNLQGGGIGPRSPWDGPVCKPNETGNGGYHHGLGFFKGPVPEST